MVNITVEYLNGDVEEYTSKTNLCGLTACGFYIESSDGNAVYIGPSSYKKIIREKIQDKNEEPK